VMPGEDLIGLGDDGVDDGVELDELAGGVEVGEPIQRGERTGSDIGEVEAVEVLECVAAAR